jgi:hypothetical protein
MTSESQRRSGSWDPDAAAAGVDPRRAGDPVVGNPARDGRAAVGGERNGEALDPDLMLSHHPARVIARRLPPSAEISGSSRFYPVGPSSTAMTCPLRSAGITPVRHYYEAVRPSPAHRYFQPRGWSRLCFFPWRRRPGSHVPAFVISCAGLREPILVRVV